MLFASLRFNSLISVPRPRLSLTHPFLLLTTGTRGDVQPYIALGLGLQNAGHAVLLAAPESFRAMAEARGLPFAPLAGNPSAWMMRDGGQAALTFDGNLLRNLRATLDYLRAVRPLYARLLESAWNVARAAQPRAVLFGLPSLWGAHIAEALRVPAIGAFLQPLTRTRAFPSVLLPTRFSLGAQYNRLTHAIVEQALWLPWRGLINQWRQNSLGLSATSRPLITDHCLYGFSPSIFPRPADWPPAHTLTGYWFLEEPPSWTPPPALLQFLESPAVFIGLGSPGTRQPRAMLTLIERAVEMAGARAVLALPGHSEPHSVTNNARIFPIGDVPHDWLFPRVRGVAHHGGAGTTAAALRAGGPQLLLPLAIDQFFWAERVGALGLGPAPLPQRSLTAEKLAQALRQLMDDDGMRERARALGEVIRGEAGVARAVEMITTCDAL